MTALLLTLALLDVSTLNPSTRPTTSPTTDDAMNQVLPTRIEPPAVVELRKKYDHDTAELRTRRDARLRALEGSTAPAAELERARKLILDQYEQGQQQLDITFSEARWQIYEHPTTQPTSQP